jgi:hypothetical protein
MKSSSSAVSHQSREYTRVASTDPGVASSTSTSPCESRSLLERLTDKGIAAVWVILAALVAHWTDSLYVFRLGPSSSSTAATANPLLMQLVGVGFGINTVLVLYLIVYLPYVKGLNDSSAWEVYCPRVIPTITVTSLVTAFLLLRATWSVWGFFAPLILGLEAMGCLFLTHFIPVWPQ